MLYFELDIKEGQKRHSSCKLRWRLLALNFCVCAGVFSGLQILPLIYAYLNSISHSLGNSIIWSSRKAFVVGNDLFILQTNINFFVCMYVCMYVLSIINLSSNIFYASMHMSLSSIHCKPARCKFLCQCFIANTNTVHSLCQEIVS